MTSIREYMTETQVEGFVGELLQEFYKSEGYRLDKEQEARTISFAQKILKELGTEEYVTLDDPNIQNLKITILRLIDLSIKLFSMNILHFARAEKLQEIILTLQKKVDEK